MPRAREGKVIGMATSSSSTSPTAPLAGLTTDPGNRSLRWPRFFLAALVLFLVVHTPPDRTETMLLALAGWLAPSTAEGVAAAAPTAEIVASYNEGVVIPLRRILFYLAAAALALPIGASLWRARGELRRLRWRRLAWQAAGIAAILCVLVTPYGGGELNRDMGIEYAAMSQAPFAASTGISYRRLLKPALAHLLQLDGAYPYFLFSMLTTYGVILLSLAYFERAALDRGEDAASRPAMPFFWALSVATSSFVLFDFQFPGYVDNLAFLLLILGMLAPMNAQARLAIVALCLATHEGIGAPLAAMVLFCYPRRLWLPALAMAGAYAVLWLANYGFDLVALLTGHSMAQAASDPSMALGESLGHIILGGLASYKLLWLAPVLVLFYRPPERSWLAALTPSLIMLSPLALLPWLIDSSRHAGWGFVGLLMAVACLRERVTTTGGRRLLHALLAVNLVIPSFVCGMLGPTKPLGLYGALYEWCRVMVEKLASG